MAGNRPGEDVRADCGALLCPVRPLVSVLGRLSIGLQHGDVSRTPA